MVHPALLPLMCTLRLPVVNWTDAPADLNGLFRLGTRVVQADSGSVSDSESRNKNEENIPVNRLTQTVFTDPPTPATTIRTRTDTQMTFFAPTLGIGVGTWICLHYTHTLSPKDEIWFLRVCHHISTGLYLLFEMLNSFFVHFFAVSLNTCYCRCAIC
jgi:hypothetical protein